MMEKMKHIAVFALTAMLLFAAAPAEAQVKQYEVTIKNLSAGQPMTPVLAISHDHRFKLFTIGKKPGRNLATLAETGNPAPLAGRIMGLDDRVMSVVTGSGLVLPGNEVTITIEANEEFAYLSFASMFAATNDAFVGLRGVKIYDGATYYLNVYDAGSEYNSESAADVPALGGMARSTAKSEGFVHVHPGVHGGADLDPAAHDWRNPGAMITIKEVN